MTLFSYVVARDYGFAPNPFFASCTLATCKPIIRRVAKLGDWVVGTGSASKGRAGYLVFAMLVSEILSFNQYWEESRYQRKKPNLRGSMKQAFGDNIYFKDDNGGWNQLDSHHSYLNGVPNPHNIRNDTQTDRVLVGEEFTYCGGSGPKIPEKFRNYKNLDICAQRNHRSRFPQELINDFLEWFRSLGLEGYEGPPIDWSKSP